MSKSAQERLDELAEINARGVDGPGYSGTIKWLISLVTWLVQIEMDRLKSQRDKENRK